MVTLLLRLPLLAPSWWYSCAHCLMQHHIAYERKPACGFGPVLILHCLTQTCE